MPSAFTHALAAASIAMQLTPNRPALIALAAVCSALPDADALAFRLGIPTFSHGVLDALTNGGLGIAFFAPLSDKRYFFPWRPILVSPISLRRFFSDRGLAILANEFAIVWIPAIVVVASGALSRHRRRRTEAKCGP